MILTIITFFISILGYSSNVLLFKEDQVNIQNYDMYLFSIQWGNTICIHSSNCMDKLKIAPKNSLTIHGLWPSQSTGAYLTDCNTGTQITIVDDSSDLFKDMRTYWLSFTGTDETFWGHEYNVHGYCYSEKIRDLDYKKYFKVAMDLYKKHGVSQMIFKAFGDVHGEKEYEYDKFIGKLKDTIPNLVFQLNCRNVDQKQHLSEIRFSFDLNFEPMKINYPTNCVSSKSIFVVFR